MKEKKILLQISETKLKNYTQKSKDFPENPIYKLKINLLESIKNYIMENIENEK